MDSQFGRRTPKRCPDSARGKNWDIFLIDVRWRNEVKNATYLGSELLCGDRILDLADEATGLAVFVVDEARLVGLSHVALDDNVGLLESTGVHLGECELLRCLRLKHLGFLLLAQASGGLREHFLHLLVGEVLLRGCHLGHNLDRVGCHDCSKCRIPKKLADEERKRRRRGAVGAGK
jgi:hypothetical protein